MASAYSYSAKAAITEQASTSGFLTAIAHGAFSGAQIGASAANVAGAAVSTAYSEASAYVPSVPLGDLAGVDLAFRPTFAYGTGGFAMGGLITGSVDLGQGVQLGFGYGGQWAHGGPASQGAGFDQQVSYGGSSRGFSYYRTHFVNNETPQIVGTVG